MFFLAFTLLNTDANGELLSCADIQKRNSSILYILHSTSKPAVG